VIGDPAFAAEPVLLGGDIGRRHLPVERLFQRDLRDELRHAGAMDQASSTVTRSLPPAANSAE
jgi:hypothetical protein